MSALLDYVAAHGHVIEPCASPELLSMSPAGGWQLAGPRVYSALNTQHTSTAIWVHPELRRADFQPNIVITAARITPVLPPEFVLDLLADTASALPNWQRRAVARYHSPHGRWVEDSLGEYRYNDHTLAASSVATVWIDHDHPTSGYAGPTSTTPSATVVCQLIVTTFADQMAAHSDALADTVAV